jgi:protocatechuate 3,4-dioxygenase beta subunit
MLVSLFRAGAGLCCLLIAAHSQTISPTPASTGVISGVVIDAKNTPVRRAIVTLSTVEARPQDAVAWTDGQGRFSFGYLPVGRYQLRAAKDGYQMAAYGAESSRRPPATIDLAAGEQRNNIVLHLPRASSISGVVLDEDGDPVSGLQVMAMTPGFSRQKRQLLPGMGTVTDSNGHYRLAGIPPGRYMIAALRTNYRQASRVHPEAAAGEPQQQYTYGAQYYPESDRMESAALVSVQAGQEISRIDFRLAARPTVFVEGKIVLPPNTTSVRDAIINAVSEDSPNGMNTSIGAGISQPDLGFRMDQLLPGRYVLIAQASVDNRLHRGVQTIEVGPDGTRDISIPLEPGIDLTGSVLIQGAGAEKYSASYVNLTPGDGLPWHGQPLRTSVKKDGSFKITGVPPGIWDIGADPIPPGGYIKSMRLGDQDVLTEEMVIRSSTTAPLKIVIGTQAATIEGDVVQQDLPKPAVVVLAPEPKFRHVTSFYRWNSTDDKGHFELKNVTPGKYQLYAFEEFDQRSIEDPGFLKQFESAGVTVTLQEGKNTPQKVSIIPAAVKPQSAGGRLGESQ